MHSTLFAAFLAEAVVTDAPFMASAIAATARLVPETILYFMLISPWEWLENRATRGPQACPQPLLRCGAVNVTLITRLLPWRPPGGQVWARRLKSCGMVRASVRELASLLAAAREARTCGVLDDFR
jgi:hypothetical protein